MAKPKPHFLTKSRFKTGHECPTKLYYLDNPEYASDNEGDSFLQALADGGFQVGELAKIYFPGGIEINEREHHKAAEKTRELLQRENVVIFEAAILWENLFVRVDIMEKKGKHIRLLEVKAKSWREGDSFASAKGDKLDSGWEPYIADIAFQNYVAQKAFPNFIYSPFLYLADKDSRATEDGIHQRFFLNKSGDRTKVEVVAGTTAETIGTPLLRAVSAESAIGLFYGQKFNGLSFDKYVAELSQIAKDGIFHEPEITRNCGSCEFRVASQDLGKRTSGFVECWTKATGMSAKEFDQPMIFNVWKLHYMKKDKLIAEKRFFIKDLTQEDIGPEADSSTELTTKQRQWLQVNYLQERKKAPYFDADHFQFRAKEERWKPPFHFIDFETLTSAIPFNKGLHPYETVAFQFSHHTVDAKGNVTHKTEYINTKPGAFPNFDFVRALKAALENDNGTVFRYAAHENTVLNHIRTQLENSTQNDIDQLVAFIDTLTIRKQNGKTIHQGARCMVDMCELVQKYYYSPLMGGSNSIKKVLPSVLQESQVLKAKYSKPIYGAPDGIRSHNFQNKAWVKVIGQEGQVEDPYKSLDPIFRDVDPELWSRIERVYADDELREGGSASTAYARMQFTRMSDEERGHIGRALLRYCELDTLAMVMIWQYWTEELLKKTTKRVA